MLENLPSIRKYVSKDTWVILGNGSHFETMSSLIKILPGKAAYNSLRQLYLSRLGCNEGGEGLRTALSTSSSLRNFYDNNTIDIIIYSSLDSRKLLNQFQIPEKPFWFRRPNRGWIHKLF